jgi:hypothetical protein
MIEMSPKYGRQPKVFVPSRAWWTPRLAHTAARAWRDRPDQMVATLKEIITAGQMISLCKRLLMRHQMHRRSSRRVSPGLRGRR